MEILALVLLFLSPQQAPPPLQSIDIRWVYITDHPVWQPPPKDPELPKYKTATPTFVVFYPSGELKTATFVVGRHGKNEPIFIIPGEGFAVRRGRWTRNPDGTIMLRYQLVYEEGLASTSVPGPIQEERWTPRGKLADRIAAKFESPRGAYSPLQSLSNLKTLNEILDRAGGGLIR
jgi:hypothetical protein